MKSYEICPKTVAARVAAITKKCMPDLAKLGVIIDLMFISHDGDGPALMHQGYAAAAVVRRTSVKDRTAGRGDAEILIDKEGYETMTERQRDALLHHELYHLIVVKDKDQRPKCDAAGRPVLKLRKHDHQFGWFVETARLYGEDSGEVQQARALIAGAGQSYFEFMKASLPAPKLAAVA